eukprot:scaffold421_cov86-Skeletonema_menzelii.AAC.2
MLPVTTQSPLQISSIFEIQKEEALRNNEDHMCRIDENQWFVQQRERAVSIGDIFQEEQQEQEMLDLIKDHKQIEMAIIENRRRKGCHEDHPTTKTHSLI